MLEKIAQTIAPNQPINKEMEAKFLGKIALSSIS